ncbi:MAG TPA: phage major capsid protein, partial [Yoonia sp.]|nr:phage major capsid protein [Yoonia sp.]
MTATESNSRGGEDVSPAQALNTAIAGFMSDFKDFSHGVNAKLQKQDDRMNKLDRKTMMTTRTALAHAASQDAPHQKAFA